MATTNTAVAAAGASHDFRLSRNAFGRLVLARFQRGVGEKGGQR